MKDDQIKPLEQMLDPEDARTYCSAEKNRHADQRQSRLPIRFGKALESGL